MQQTKKYQFNLIEPSDTFSPDRLNENMEKVEAALTDGLAAEAAAREAANAALDQRLQVFEAKRFEISTYTGMGGNNYDFSLGYTPKLLMVAYGNATYIVFQGMAVGATNVAYLSIIDGGFRAGLNLNKAGATYHYLAID